MKIPKEIQQTLFELGIEILKALKEIYNTKEIEQEKGDTNANRPEDLQRACQSNNHCNNTEVAGDSG